MSKTILRLFSVTIIIVSLLLSACQSREMLADALINASDRERISINDDWRFFKYDSQSDADNLIYDIRPEITDNNFQKEADAKPTEAVAVSENEYKLKPWILPSANRFIKDPHNRHIRPAGNPGNDFPFVKSDFDDQDWEKVTLPHDWAIKGPFMEGPDPEVSGGMGRLPVNGVGWYRKKLDIPASDVGKSFFLDVDGAMSYAMVWLNGSLVGGWPYGYNSWRLDLTPYIIPGAENQLAVRIDNPNHSARWYPGAGIYRNVWLTKTNPVHLGHWGTFITSTDITPKSATLTIEITLDNDTEVAVNTEIITKVYELVTQQDKKRGPSATFLPINVVAKPGESVTVAGVTKIENPKLWGPRPSQSPHLYMAVTTVYSEGELIDSYETRFGIRTIEFNPDQGIIVNGEHIPIQGVNQHHDLGALGAAFNTRAAERQLEILMEMGCNAIRMAHNPPSPELMELTDKMGFLVVNELFDSWERKKTPHDFHLVFPEWYEPDTRAFIRRDRNCPSVIMWSFGNEVGEQYTGNEGAAVASRIYDIVKEEDPTRPTTLAMNFAKPDMPLPAVPDVIGLNYQGEGIRQDPEFEGTDRIRTAPQYKAFHAMFPEKMIFSSETASAFSSRGVYLFPVSESASSPVRDGRGGDSQIRHVSSYELYTVDFGSSAEKVFGSLEQHPFVAGEFVWTGWDYLGEPTPYYESRSTYCGIIDLAGFKKDRFYLYQSHWRPEVPMAHILPHWNWPERTGEVTPVHVFTSGEEAELFLNGKSMGRKKKAPFQYRLRWDNIIYEPGELKVIAYKDGVKWVENRVLTTGDPKKLIASADRTLLKADGKDLAFITVQVVDENGREVPRSENMVEFAIEGPGEIVATDNGDPTNMRSFSSAAREVFNGKCIVIVRSINGDTGKVTVTAKSPGLEETAVHLLIKR